MKKKILGLAVVLVLLAAGVMVHAKSKATAKKAPEFGMKRDLLELTALVTDVDPDKHLLSLKGPDNNTVTFQVDDQVKNLNQIKKKDMVRIKYYESMVWSLRKPSERTSQPTMNQIQTTSVGTTGKGPPSGEKEQKTELIATIDKIDPNKQWVTLKGPAGKKVALHVQNPQILGNVKVGDQVDIIFSQSLAMSVEETPKK
jgi:hypothetical protein